MPENILGHVMNQLFGESVLYACAAIMVGCLIHLRRIADGVAQ